jgi:hypothetical protein
MIVMSKRRFAPQLSHANDASPIVRNRGYDLRIATAARPAANNDLLRRPAADVLSSAIPLIFIGRNRDGFWVARDADGQFGGIFLSQRSALRFTDRHTRPAVCATMILSERFELDIENRGNRFVAHLVAAKRILTRIANGITAS